MEIGTEDEYTAAMERANGLRARGDSADASDELAELDAAIQSYEAERDHRDTPGRPALHSIAPDPRPAPENRPGSGSFSRPHPEPDRDE